MEVVYLSTYWTRADTLYRSFQLLARYLRAHGEDRIEGARGESTDAAPAAGGGVALPGRHVCTLLMYGLD
jgi:hypothetical protein